MFQKIVKDGYINSIVDGVSIGNITEAEYDEILEVVRNRPEAQSGYIYRLKEDLTWEKHELLPESGEDE